MNKYKAGGRCGGNSTVSEYKGSTNTSLASLISAREAQDASFTATSDKTVQAETVQTKTVQVAADKKSCIDIIMSYDGAVTYTSP